MGPGVLSSPVVTSYSLPIVTIGLSLTVYALRSAPTCHRQTDRQTDGRDWSSKRRYYALMYIGRQLNFDCLLCGAYFVKFHMR